MLGKEFRGLAETVTRTYGEDPWFFLRELAQNSRDAGARNIWVSAETSAPGLETFTFADDGRGMTLAQARRFLFRLYASDKTADAAAAGKYCIGFLAILRFQPTVIHLQSRRGKHSWAVELDRELNVRPAACLLTRSGTTVSLSRPTAFSSQPEYRSLLESELREYCQYLRRNDRKASMLPVWFANKNLTRPMTLPGPLSCRFRSGAVEGAVAIAEKPQVWLYARGLPVWQGAVLNQMSHLQMDTESQPEIGRGLAPVFLLNGNRLDVTFSRHLALENRALATVRKKTEAALRRLLAGSLERTFPRTWQQRCRDGLYAAWKRILRPGRHWLLLLLLIIVPLEITLLRHWFPAGAPARSSPFSLQSATLSYGGATVSLSAAAGPPPFSYLPKIPTWFRLFAADTYDIQAGFVRRAERGRSPARQTEICRPEQSLSMSFPALAGGEIFLPLPPGHVLQAGSVLLDGRRIGSVFSSIQGETIAAIGGSGGVVEYRSCPAEPYRELTGAESSRLTSLPQGLTLPAALEKTVRESRAFTLAARVELARELTRDLVAYDASAATARQYSRPDDAPTWLARVLRIGKGDCDIINGLGVLLMRKMGIPCRLVIGMIGERGSAGPLLHAWSEYFDQGWTIMDASAGLPVGPASSAAASSAGPGRHLAIDDDGVRRRDSRIEYLLLGTALILLAETAACGLLFYARKRRAGEDTFPAEEQMKIQLMQLVRQAMLQPEIWGRDNPLWSHPLLPTVDGKAVSIRRALRLLGKKKLFFTCNRNPLALAMMNTGITVLDLGQTLYHPLRTLLAGAIDTDMLCQLRPVPPRLPDPGLKHDLLGDVNALLHKMMSKPVFCLLAPGLLRAELLKIALPAPLRRGPFFFPQRFIAVNPAGAVFRHMSSLYDRNQPLAVFKFLLRLNADRLLDGCSGPALRQKAARRLLGMCP